MSRRQSFLLREEPITLTTKADVQSPERSEYVREPSVDHRTGSLRSRTAENVAILVFLQWMSLGFSTITKIVLVRLLFPADFGIFALAVGFIGVLSTFGNFGLDYAIIQKGASASEVEYDVAMSLRLLMSSVLFGATIILAVPWADLFSTASVGPATQVLGLTYLITPWGFVPGTRLTSSLRYRALILPNVVTQLVDSSISILLAAIGLGFWALVAGMVASQVAWVVSLALVSPYRFHLRFDRLVAIPLLKYARYIVAASVLAFLMTNIDNFTVGFLLGSSTLGYYAVAYSFCLLSSMISGSAAAVLFPSFSKMIHDKSRLRRGYIESFAYALATVAPAAIGIAALAPELVGVLFGPLWAPVILPLTVLAFYGLSKAVMDFGTPLFAAVGTPRIITELNAVVFLLSAALLVPLVWVLGLLGAAIAMTVPVSVAAGISIKRAARAVGVRPRELVRTSPGVLFAAEAMGLMVLGMKYVLSAVVLNSGSLMIGPVAMGLESVTLLIGIPAGTVLYFALLRVFERDVFEGIRRSLKVLVRKSQRREAWEE